MTPLPEKGTYHAHPFLPPIVGLLKHIYRFRYFLCHTSPVASVVQLVTSKPSDVGTRVRISVFQPQRTVFTEHTFAVGNRRCGAHARCSRRNNPCQDVSLHGKSCSAGAPNALCPQPETCRTHLFVKLTMLHR